MLDKVAPSSDDIVDLLSSCSDFSFIGRMWKAALHKFPEEIETFFVVKASDKSSKTFIFLIFLDACYLELKGLLQNLFCSLIFLLCQATKT